MPIVTKNQASDVPRRRLIGRESAKRISPRRAGQSIVLRSLAALILVAGFPAPGADGQFNTSAPRRFGSGSVTLIATLETLGVTVAPIDARPSIPAGARSDWGAYAVTTRWAVMANRTTIHLSWAVQGSASTGFPSGESKPISIRPDPDGDEVLLPFAMTGVESSRPTTRTDFLNIRMNNGTLRSERPRVTEEQLDIVAQAL